LDQGLGTLLIIFNAAEGRNLGVILPPLTLVAPLSPGRPVIKKITRGGQHGFAV
jgi:hypothetical protein